MQFQADVLGSPVIVPEISETTALGAAYLAGIAVGTWDRETVAGMWRQRVAYEPRMSEDRRETLISRWHEAVSRSRGWTRPTAYGSRGMSTHLVTGFPGFIGRRLVATLLDARPRRRGSSPWSSRACSTRPGAPPRASTAGGSRCSPATSPTAASASATPTTSACAAEVDVVYHLAAIYDLAVPLEHRPARERRRHRQRARRSAAAAEQLERLNYVSTAYVAGDAHRRRLRARARRWARTSRTTTSRRSSRPRSGCASAMDKVPTTIYRPGDRRRRLAHGRDAEVRRPVLHAALRSPRAERAGCRSPQIGRGAAPFNVVPVDFIVDAMVALGRADRRDRARPFTSATPSRSAPREMFELLTDLYAGPAPAYRVPPRLVAAALRFGADPQRSSAAPRRESIRYLNHPVRYDTRRAGELLARVGSALPELPGVRPGDGRLLPRARGRSGAGAGGGFPVTTGRSGGREWWRRALSIHVGDQATAIQGRTAG